MLLPRLTSAPARSTHWIVACALLTCALSLCGLAQNASPAASPAPPHTSSPAVPSTPQPEQKTAQPQQVHLVDYSKPRSAFPNLLQPYLPRPLAEVNLSNSARIDSLLQDGKIYLSIDDAIALALENNLDLEIARYNLNIADADILRAKSGANILGVNTGVVQNTPGGGVGGLGGTVGSGAGGTTVAPGGAGTGTNGLVSSTLGIGSPIVSFDPALTGTLQLDKNNTESTSIFSPVPIVAQNTYTADFGYTQGFQWGTTLNGGFNNTHVTTNNPTTLLSPDLTANFQFRLTQNLLQGFGILPNTRFIRIAQNNRKISNVAFRLQVITTVDQIENMYWTDQQNLIVAQNNLELQQLLMKNALSRSIEDPVLADADVIPTSTMLVPQQEPATSTLELIAEALQQRAELAESRIDLDTRNLNNKTVRNAMLPTLDAFAYYGGSGLGGDVARPTCSSTITSDCFNPKNAAPPFVTGGPVSYPGTLKQLVNGTAPDKGVGLTLNIPLRNRQAQANQVRAQLEYRQAQVRQHQLENQVRIEVRNAQFDVKQNRAAVQAAQSAAEFARESLNSEEEKLKVGLSTQTAVLQQASVLTSTESNLVSAKAAYEKSRIELERATGALLEHSGIDVAGATRGQVTKLPSVPYVAPRQDVPPAAPQQPAPPQSAPAQPGGQM